MSGYDRRKHGFDGQQINLINCPNDRGAPWSWNAEGPIDEATSLPPFCPACGERVKVWQVSGEFDDDPVLMVPSVRPTLEDADRCLIHYAQPSNCPECFPRTTVEGRP